MFCWKFFFTACDYSIKRLVISASCEWSCALPRVSWVELGRQNYEYSAFSAANKPMDQGQKT